MQVIEFETTAQHRTIQLPPGVPDGVNLRVLVLLEGTPAPATASTRREPNRPAPQLAGSVSMTDDLIEPAVPESDWNALQ
jgi:hypothetical protein